MRKAYVTFCSVICIAWLIYPFELQAVPPTTYIVVAAGTLDRREAVVTFTLPKETKVTSYNLRDEAGHVIPLQLGAHHQATFILPELKAGTTKKYRLEVAKPGATNEGVQLLQAGNKLNITSAGRRVLGYQTQGELPRADIKPIFRRGGYLFPVYTPAGRIITDDYPPNHVHHHSIWFAWTKTEFEGRPHDFWNMGDGTGTVEFQSLDATWSGPVEAGFKARHRYVALDGQTAKTALNEMWEVKVYRVAQGQPSMFDLTSIQECATSSPLLLPEYHYGGIGVRGHRDWDGKDNAFFLTSEGKDRSNGNATNARWCAIGGRIEGQVAGIAVLSHPDNFRAPQPLRLHPTEPYLCFAPSQKGSWEIAPGQLYTSRYRFIVYDGPPDAALLDRLWHDYATPPKETLTHQ